MFSSSMFQNNLSGFWKEKRLELFVLCEFYKGKSWNFSKINFETPSIARRNFEFGQSVSYR